MENQLYVPFIVLSRFGFYVACVKKWVRAYGADLTWTESAKRDKK